jgi:thermostable 8-oxoguanine DNA glycosylase
MLRITSENIEGFRRIKNLFYGKTKLPVENNWKDLSNDEIWLHVVAQVMVVGRSSPYEKFNSSKRLKDEISYDTLSKISEEERKRRINNVLLAVGTRYASSDVAKCLKTKALAHNFSVLAASEDCPRGFLKKISEFSGPEGDKERISFVTNSFMFIENKGARDLLMELGIVKNALALDVRMQNILQRLGIRVPEGFQSSPKLYSEVESKILEKICRPLGLTGVELDRMLYQNYEEIMKSL